MKEAQKARTASREKARRLTRQDELTRALEHHRSMADQIQAELQGRAPAKPKRRRKTMVGDVEGVAGQARADRKPRASAGKRDPFASGGAPRDAEPSWSDAAHESIRNLGPSMVHLGRDVGSAVMHPATALNAINGIARGLASQAAGAVGVPQDPTEKERAEAPAREAERPYASVAGFKRAVAKDPARTAAGLALLPWE